MKGEDLRPGKVCLQYEDSRQGVGGSSRAEVSVMQCHGHVINRLEIFHHDSGRWGMCLKRPFVICDSNIYKWLHKISYKHFNSIYYVISTKYSIYSVIYIDN